MSLPSPASRRNFRRRSLGSLAVLALSLTAACAQVNLDDYLHPTPSPTPAAPTIPAGMVMPTPVPTAQPSKVAKAHLELPDLKGYTKEPTATPTPVKGRTESSTTWTSRTTMCSITATLTTSKELLLAGGDDRQITKEWNAGNKDVYRRYKQSSAIELKAGPKGKRFEGISTAFNARISGSDVAGRTFTRVWSADGVVLNLTEICQKGRFDTTTWDTLRQGVQVTGLSGTSRWPGTVKDDKRTSSQNKKSSTTAPSKKPTPTAHTTGKPKPAASATPTAK